MLIVESREEDEEDFSLTYEGDFDFHSCVLHICGRVLRVG